jgi:myo-inositol-1(or 4)-monophosphatase
MTDVLDTAVAAARAGAEVLLGRWRNLPAGSIEEKQKNDFVTVADRESERRIVSVIRDRFPTDDFLGEEGGWQGGGAMDGDRRSWIVDPLDGTANFIAGFPFWCVSIAARERGRIVAGAVLDPLRDELYTAERGSGAHRNGVRLAVTPRPSLDGSFMATGFPFRSRDRIDDYLALFKTVFLSARGIRRAGSAALDLAYVAAGVFDGFFEFHLAPWDIAAGVILIEEAGGVLTDFDGGERYWERGNIIAGSPGVSRDMLAIAARMMREDDIGS